MNYLITDHLSSVVAVTDASGLLLEETRYMPFGSPRSDVGAITQTDKAFTGQKVLANTGLLDYNARFYSSELGRFTQPDTIIPGAGNSQAWNRYSYVMNNPVRYTDPSGHNADCGIGDPYCQGLTPPEEITNPLTAQKTPSKPNRNSLGDYLRNPNTCSDFIQYSNSTIINKQLTNNPFTIPWLTFPKKEVESDYPGNWNPKPSISYNRNYGPYPPYQETTLVFHLRKNIDWTDVALDSLSVGLAFVAANDAPQYAKLVRKLNPALGWISGAKAVIEMDPNQMILTAGGTIKGAGGGFSLAALFYDFIYTSFDTYLYPAR